MDRSRRDTDPTAPTTEPAWEHEPYREQEPHTVTLDLTVNDPELVAALEAYPAGRARDRFALTALRIGILALRQAQGRVDSETVRAEGDRLLGRLADQLERHREHVTGELTGRLREYFDPNSGRFDERITRLVQRDGELEQVLTRQIGEKDSGLARTLSAHLGEQSPLMKVLSPDASQGLLHTLQSRVDEALRSDRERIVREFSLDQPESALSRLVRELTQRHGELTRSLQGSVKDVVDEFSLDNEDSALSRLVRRVESAQRQISSEFSLDTGDSALARLKREMLEVLNAYRKDSASFQQEVREALADMRARREEALRSTTHGGDFEIELLEVVTGLAQQAGDVASHVGNTTGRIKHNKKGDILIELGPEHAAAGGLIVVEAKQDASYDLAKARAEIDEARRNRAAEVGLFVFSSRCAGATQEPLLRFGQDVFAVWDADDPASDVMLKAAVSLCRALCTRAAMQRDAEVVDFVAMDRSIREIEKQAANLESVATWSSTIRANSDKIIGSSRRIRESLLKQAESLDRTLSEIREHLNSDNEGP
jgi:hypothetical protein